MSMKEIKAIIKPFVLDKVISALERLEDLPGVTISEVTGRGRLSERCQDDDHAEAGHGVSKRTKLEIVVKDEQVEPVVEAIVAAARTGNRGDGA